MNAKTIQKYKKKTVPQLRKIAKIHFHKFIRLRDQDKGCVSCPSHKVEHASHFYSAGNYPNMEFNEMNVHGSCVKCNTFLHGNLNEYRLNLPLRIGNDELLALDELALIYKRNGYKHDRFFLIEVIETYKQKNKSF